MIKIQHYIILTLIYVEFEIEYLLKNIKNFLTFFKQGKLVNMSLFI